MPQAIAVIDYGSGNLRSAVKALDRAASDHGISASIEMTADPARVAKADRIVLPGVGAFSDCMTGLSGIAGMRTALEEAVIRAGRPFLGICVGMQLMAAWGREHGDHQGLGWIEGQVVPLMPANKELKVPHMGWNDLTRTNGSAHSVLDTAWPAAGTPPHAYFVHSFHFVPQDPSMIVAAANYGGSIAAVVARDNLIGTQFHPEKSQGFGLAFLAAFLRWRP